MGDYFNYIIDNLISVTWRLTELPLYVLVLIVGILFIGFNLASKKWLTKISGTSRKTVGFILFILMMVLIIDKKISNVRSELSFLNEKVSNVQMNSSKTNSEQKESAYVINLKKEFPQSEVFKRQINSAIELFSIRKKNPNAVAYISIIDLDNPKVKIKITSEKKQKYLTSTFAKENDCIIAINGEAGESMAMDCKLGEWSGNWIVQGKPIMMLDTDKRPFIGFNKSNIATYYKTSIVDTTYTEEKYNTLWGRHDILINGQLETGGLKLREYARTIMGINKSGNKLFLMVVDGKRPDYSIGLTYDDCAKMLKSLGAYNAMACDQGGSSCMYISTMGGIINRPADSDGIERKIYTHFGISME